MKSNKIRITSLSTQLEQEIIDNYKRLLSLRSVAKIYGCGSETVKKILIRNGVQTLSGDEYRESIRPLSDTQIQEVIDLYTNKQNSISQIGKLYNVAAGVISKTLRANKIVTHIKVKPIRNILIENREKVLEIYNKNNLLEDVAQYFQTSVFNVSAFFISQGIEYKTRDRILNTITSKNIDHIRDLYCNQQKNLQYIAKIYNCSGPTISTILKTYNIPKRTKAESIRLNNLTEEHQRKAINGSFRIKSYKLPSGIEVRIQGYEPQFLDYIFKNNLLKEDEIDYKPKRIQYFDNTKKRHYYPDFFIPKLNLIVEIKSDYILSRQTPENALLKESATKALGLNYIMILDNNFDEITKLLK